MGLDAVKRAIHALRMELVGVTADGVRVACDEPVRAPAKGQAAALYDGDRVIAGGWIC